MAETRERYAGVRWRMEKVGKTSSEEGLRVSPAFHSCPCVDTPEAEQVAPTALAMGSTARSQGKAGAERCSPVRRGAAGGCGQEHGTALRRARGTRTTARTLKSAVLK